MTTRLLSTARIRRIEASALAVTGPGELMKRAAGAVAREAERCARELARGIPVIVLAGPGNNGGDALLAGLRLARRGYAVRAFAMQRTPPRASDGARAWQSWQRAFGEPAPLEAALGLIGAECVVIDGLFGIGLDRPLAGVAAQVAAMLAPERVHRHGTARCGRPAVVAVDVPSGIDSDTGGVVGGPAANAVAATVTVTMIADKPGLHTGRACDHAGLVVVDRLGLDASVDASPADPSDLVLLDDVEAASLWRPRARDTHKGSYGDLLIAGGAKGMHGAALLAARGAQVAGAGKIYIASPAGVLFDPAQPQWMSRGWGASLDATDAAVIGCGLGTGDAAIRECRRLLQSALPLVVDADALTVISADPALRALLGERQAPCVLTPHPLEAARLLASTAAGVQADRPRSARTLASELNAVVLLKGAGTVIADAYGRCAILAAGSPSLATAGTGDVLSGMIGALLAQRGDPFDAARAAAWAHARGGERFEQSHARAIGLSAAELPLLARAVLNDATARS